MYWENPVTKTKFPWGQSSFSRWARAIPLIPGISMSRKATSKPSPSSSNQLSRVRELPKGSSSAWGRA